MVKINFFYPRWGAEHVDWVTFLNKVKSEGYQGIEWFPFGENVSCDYEYVLDLLQEIGLKYTIVMTVQERHDSFDEYLVLLAQQLEKLSMMGNYRPLFISAQVGREYFSEDQVCVCLDMCDQVEKKMGIQIFQETHRNKWNYGIHKLDTILDRCPNLKLTLDISHWYCVSESFLHDQQALLNRILPHVYHIHARVGHTQGAQVHDVSHPMYSEVISEHINVWQQYIETKLSKGISELSFTTEFGPPPYLISSGDPDVDYQEQWRQNLWIKQCLENRLKIK